MSVNINQTSPDGLVSFYTAAISEKRCFPPDK